MKIDDLIKLTAAGFTKAEILKMMGGPENGETGTNIPADNPAEPEKPSGGATNQPGNVGDGANQPVKPENSENDGIKEMMERLARSMQDLQNTIQATNRSQSGGDVGTETDVDIINKLID